MVQILNFKLPILTTTKEKERKNERKKKERKEQKRKKEMNRPMHKWKSQEVDISLQELGKNS